jgi:hypothetical protein
LEVLKFLLWVGEIALGIRVLAPLIRRIVVEIRVTILRMPTMRFLPGGPLVAAFRATAIGVPIRWVNDFLPRPAR